MAPLPTSPLDTLVPPAPAAEVAAAAAQPVAGGGADVRLPGEPVKPIVREGTGSAAKSTVSVPPTSRLSVARSGRTAPSASAGNAAAPVRPATAASSPAVSPRVPNRDLIDLFADTK
jgi:hypothetical protein